MNKHAGVETRHSRSCGSRKGEKCSCRPTFQAHVWSRRERKRIRKTFKTFGEAKTWRADAVQALQRNVMRSPAKTTLREEAEAWLAGTKDGSIRTRTGDEYKPSVIRSYETNLAKRILPELGAERLSEITHLDLQALADRMLAAGDDPATVRNALVPLRSLYRRALKRGLVAVNPTVGLELPAPQGTRDRIASPAEAARLLEALEAWPSTERDVALWATALYAGLRRGELQGLRFEDVELGEGVIRVERSWDEVEGVPIATKSRAGRRTVPLPAVLRRYLAAHHLRTPHREGLMFARPSGEPFIASNLRARALTAWKQAGIAPIGLHEARHTYASLMIAAGVNAKALTSYMGHSSITVTFDRYGHLMPGNEEVAAGLLDTYLERAQSER
jgi:integrase